MLIGIDASRAWDPAPTGTELYSRRLIQALLALASPHRLRLYVRSAPPAGLFPSVNPPTLPPGPSRSADPPPGPFRSVNPANPCSTAELRTIRCRRLWTHLGLSWEMARRPPDVLFVPAHVLPLVHPRVSLVTVHDLGYLYFPEAHPFHQRWYLDLSTRWSARAAAHLLADSAATRADLLARYGVPADKITVAWPGRDETLLPVRDRAAIEQVKARYGIAGDYFLYLGTLQPRKNLARIVAAFASLQSQAVLVLAGKRGWLYEALFAQARRMGLGGRVLFPGYVPDEDKAALLSGALAFVFPSLYEGFGLPVLEAQSCGCPVVASTTSSLPEVAGDAALLVDPGDVAAIAAAMGRLAAEPVLRQALVERGFANVRRFSWAACARTVMAVMERVPLPSP